MREASPDACASRPDYESASGQSAYSAITSSIASSARFPRCVLRSTPSSPRKFFREKTFVATKVWIEGRSAGIEQMKRSMKLLRCTQIDLMQIHNLVDWRTHLATLRAWKAEGRIRYLGITHYNDSAYAELEKIMRGESLDFVQLN